MDMADMLDVLHYYMEEDFQVSSAEVAEARDKARSIIYKDLYNRGYKKRYQSDVNGFDLKEPLNDSITPLDPEKGPTKSYVPPTDFNPDSTKPFGDVLDAPLEH